MKSLIEVEPETKVVVRKIEGGSEIKASLGDLGIEEGTELTLLASEPIHAHVGPISLKVADKEVIVSQGWAAANKHWSRYGGEGLGGLARLRFAKELVDFARSLN